MGADERLHPTANSRLTQQVLLWTKAVLLLALVLVLAPALTQLSARAPTLAHLLSLSERSRRQGQFSGFRRAQLVQLLQPVLETTQLLQPALGTITCHPHRSMRRKLKPL